MAMFILPKHSTAKTLRKKRFCVKMIKPNKRHSPKCCKTPGVPFSAPPDLIANVGVPQGWQNASCFTLPILERSTACGFRRKSLDDFCLDGSDGEVSKYGEPPLSQFLFPESSCMFRKKPIIFYRGLYFDCKKKNQGDSPCEMGWLAGFLKHLLPSAG